MQRVHYIHLFSGLPQIRAIKKTAKDKCPIIAYRVHNHKYGAI